MSKNKHQTVVNIDMSQAKEIPSLEPVATLEPNPINLNRENTRGRLATSFIAGFFIVIIISLVVAYMSPGDKVANIKDVLLTVSGVLSVPFGFVMGYYFKSNEES